MLLAESENVSSERMAGSGVSKLASEKGGEEDEKGEDGVEAKEEEDDYEEVG